VRSQTWKPEVIAWPLHVVEETDDQITQVMLSSKREEREAGRKREV
jgi:hypothetical protein